MLHSLMLARAFHAPKTTQNASADIYDAGDHYLLQLEAVGFDKEEISLQVTGNTLFIEAEKENEIPEGYTLRYGNKKQNRKIHRRFRFHESLKTEEIQATMENGLLEVTLPKRSARQIPITVQ